MKKRYAFILIIIVLIISLAILSQKYIVNNFCNADSSSRQFVEALITGEYTKAEGLSLGEVKFNIATNKERKFDSSIIDIKSKVTKANKKYAITEVIVEYFIEDEVNLTALKLYLLNEYENKYKVYKIEEVSPYFDIAFNMINNEDITEIEKCFSDYVKGLADKKYSESSRLLIGKAKTAHNVTSELIKNTNLIIEPKDIHSEYVYGNRNNAVMKFEYTNNDKEVVSVVSFYKTIEGWKIYDVSQI